MLWPAILCAVLLADLVDAASAGTTATPESILESWTWGEPARFQFGSEYVPMDTIDTDTMDDCKKACVSRGCLSLFYDVYTNSCSLYLFAKTGSTVGIKPNFAGYVEYKLRKLAVGWVEAREGLLRAPPLTNCSRMWAQTIGAETAMAMADTDVFDSLNVVIHARGLLVQGLPGGDCRVPANLVTQDAAVEMMGQGECRPFCGPVHKCAYNATVDDYQHMYTCHCPPENVSGCKHLALIAYHNAFLLDDGKAMELCEIHAGY